MTKKEADKKILSGWDDIAYDLADACIRYANSGPVIKDSYIYDLWMERASLLIAAANVGNTLRSHNDH